MVNGITYSFILRGYDWEKKSCVWVGSGETGEIGLARGSEVVLIGVLVGSMLGGICVDVGLDAILRATSVAGVVEFIRNSHPAKTITPIKAARRDQIRIVLGLIAVSSLSCMVDDYIPIY